MVEMSHRARRMMLSFQRESNGAFKSIDRYRGHFSRLYQVPPWCFTPHDAWVSAWTQINGSVDNDYAEMIAAIGTWRLTQGIYRFDPLVLDSLIETPITGDIPIDVLTRLPEWCVYVETPGYAPEMIHKTKGLTANPVFGAWIMMGFGTEIRYPFLTIVVDTEDGLVPLIVELGGSLADVLDKYEFGVPDHLVDTAERLSGKLLSTFINMALYLCAEPDYAGAVRPRKPSTSSTAPTNVAKGIRVWNVGVRLGAELRKAQDEYRSSSEGDGTGTPRRPHVRRAHWHGYWTGPRTGERSFVLKWIPPLIINAQLGDPLPSTIRPVAA